MTNKLKKALVVGIDYYHHASPLFGCVNDAYAVKNVLERDSDGTLNFGIKLMVGTGPGSEVFRYGLKQAIKDLFAADNEIALFYFAGHGHIEPTGGYLLSSDSSTGDDGISLSEVITLANGSPARNKVIVLDSCYSGIAGTTSFSKNSDLSEGLTILTASTEQHYANEENSSGVFTTLFIDALNGGASNLVGDVTPGAVYAYIDQSLGSWQQRPVFKTNVQYFASLRKVQPPISLADLLQITNFFPAPGYEFQLDPTFEPVRSGSEDKNVPAPNPENTRKFSILQKYNRVNLVVPVDAPHMWHAAMGGKSCKLTVLGEHYRKLVKNGLI